MRTALLLLLAATAATPRFLPDDPLLRDPDDMPIDKPAAVELSTAFDVIENTFRHRPHGRIPPAVNINTVGEVPDSSWFTNRGPLTEDELRRGAGDGSGPADGPWTVVGAKTQGITPGFTMRDGAGRVWFVKFDPPRYPHLATSADVVVSRFFHAFGYNVPHNVPVRFDPARLRVDAAATVAIPSSGGKRRPLVQADVDSIVARVPRLDDGRVLAVASLRVEGQPLGPFEYRGTRGDDPNDVFPHEHRRELRGLRVFAAWLNHDDSRSLNTLDVFVPGADGRGFVRHYLIDFSSTLGAGSDAQRRIAPQNPRAGNEYVVDWGPIARSALSFGLLDRPWRNVRYEEHAQAGHLEADFFRPEHWKPEYPNPAFERMLPEDAFWATKIVARFDEAAVRALVATGEYSDPAAAGHLVRMLVARRDKILRSYLTPLSPLDGFVVSGDTLAFRHLGIDQGLGTVDGYDYEWSAFDNMTGARMPLSSGQSTTTVVPRPATDAAFVVVRVRGRSSLPGWRKWVDVFLRNGEAPAVVGVERES